MSHEIESALFSAREGAGWTGLGRAIPAEIARDPRKIAELLGATWTVQPRALYLLNDDGSYREVGDARAQVRSDTGRVLSLTSESRYHTSNRQPVDILEAFRDQLNAQELEISHAAVLRGGSFIAVSAVMPAEFDIMVAGKDRLNRYVTLSTGYDLKNGTKATRGTVRVVCRNTLQASLSQAAKDGTLKTIRASSEIGDADLRALVNEIKTYQNGERALYDAMANTRMSDADVARYFADCLSIKIEDLGKKDRNGDDLISTRSRNMLAAITDAYSKGPGAQSCIGTEWGALNAVTYYATHVKSARDTTSDGAILTRIASNMTGDSAKLKARALELLSRSKVAA